MRVEKATRGDLDFVLSWLQLEYAEKGEGFWSNKDAIRSSLGDDTLWIIRNDGKVAAFQVGNYSADIVCVREDLQGQGLGTKLFEASLARAIRDDVNLLTGECSPPTSLSFWEKHGFERYGDQRTQSSMSDGYCSVSLKFQEDRRSVRPPGWHIVPLSARTK
jgi:GNAT superfamily N-acetyltransferase